MGSEHESFKRECGKMKVDRRNVLMGGIATGLLAGCQGSAAAPVTNPVLKSFDPKFADLIDPSAGFEVLSSGYTWSEGPAWDRARNVLYFSDVPENVAYRWSAADGTTVFLDPSGGEASEGFREPGSNGLWYTQNGELIICNHGTRRVERLNLETMERAAVVDRFEGKPLNSPNDVVEAADGTLYFTDPPYGLEGLNASPLKEQHNNGVYRLRPGGALSQIVSDMTFPNGVALSPDESKLYVAQSDPDAPIIRELGLDADGEVTSDRILFDAKPLLDEGKPGLPDGMAISTDGTLFATGPGGVLVIDPDGTLLGIIDTGSATANCAFGEDGSVLFITAADRLLRMQTQAKGVQWS